LRHLRGISIHALREEGDARKDAIRKHFFTFQSTPSARRATAERGRVYASALGVISIHALREEGDHGVYRRWGSSQVSIHALREEGD